MDTQTDIDTQNEWLNLVVAGRKEAIDSFWKELGAAHLASWSRDHEAERDQKPRSSAVFDSMCFALKQPVVRVWLYRLSPIRVQGGRVDQAAPADHSQYLNVTAEAIRSFRRDVLDPAARRYGLNVGSQRLGPHSLVPNWIIDALWSFYDVSAFQWPPTGQAMEHWREFVITTYQNNAAFDARELKRWLTEKGWSESAADQLIAQKDADATLLGKYDDLRQSA